MEHLCPLFIQVPSVFRVSHLEEVISSGCRRGLSNLLWELIDDVVQILDLRHFDGPLVPIGVIKVHTQIVMHIAPMYRDSISILV